MIKNFLDAFSKFYLDVVKATNEVHTNVWAVVVICLGIVATGLDYKDIGRDLLIGGFAMLQRSTNPTQPVVTPEAGK